ncbi:hypothetical protein [Methanospirillum sp.]|uniref:hypothetical protein n=1 Tax=Methanospirillum sp. TaxID=45200 RepID=UPI001BD5951A
MTEWGSHGTGFVQLDYLVGICPGKLGNVYIADTRNNRIQKLSDVKIENFYFR